jgi:hypothetical protein
MDTFSAIVFGSILAAFLVFVLLGWLSRKQPAGEITDKEANSKLGAQAEIEARDVPEMVDAANRYRRKRGLPASSVADFQRRRGS